MLHALTVNFIYLVHVSANDGVDQLPVFVGIYGTNFGDELSPDGSVGERYLVLALLKFWRVVVAVDDVDDDQRGAGKRPRGAAVGGHDGDEVTFLTLAIEAPFEEQAAGKRVNLEDV